MKYEDLKARNEELEAELQTYHLFYENLNHYELMISNGIGVMMQMWSSVNGLKKSGKSSPKIEQQESMIKEVINYFESLQSLSKKAQDLKLFANHKQLEIFHLNQKIEALSKEIEAIKSAFEKE